jgi:tRNA threonylcarbamoyladenosine biosynthesis protein TsaB
MRAGEKLVLAIDTSLRNGSVCLARGDAAAFELIGSAEVDGGMFSAQLVPVIAKLLANHRLTKNELQGVAAAVGPGSFTGLRIGLAAVKGLAEVLEIPIAAVSTLEAVAAAAGGPDDVIAVLDAGRNEFYVGEYSAGRRVRESLLSGEELAALVADSKALIVSPNEIVGKHAGHSFQRISYPGAETIARLGLKKLAAGETTATDALDANYVRRDEGLFAPIKN